MVNGDEVVESTVEAAKGKQVEAEVRIGEASTIGNPKPSEHNCMVTRRLIRT